tara:strand:+ start:165 stop:755 length:591 start_codon:yes stop_codon:yes gene_type:complete
MSVYNLNLEGSMPPTVLGGTIIFYENLSSIVDIANTKNLIALCRARKTNITRFVSCYPTGGSGDAPDPTYNSNSRYWQFGITFLYGSAGIASVYDVYAYRQLGTVVMPFMDTLDIDLYYANSNSYAIADLTKIEGTSIVVNLTVDETYVHKGDLPFSYYTEYTDNDVDDVIPGATGEPSSADEELDAQYGTQIWQV